MKKLSIIFAGTAQFAVPILEALISDPRFNVSSVITAPDKPAGRNRALLPSSVKLAALSNKLIVHQPVCIKELEQNIIQEKPDFFLLTAYGQIITKNILKIPKLGAINIHGSLLPKYRGASPIQEAILNGDRISGVTWIVMNERLDEGDIIAKKEVFILPQDTYETLSQRLADISAGSTPDVLAKYAEKPAAEKQKGEASFCGRIDKKDGFINVRKESAEKIERKIRAYTPWPGCFILWNGKRLKIIGVKVCEQKIDTGEVAIVNGETLMVGTTEKSLMLIRVQLEGKKELNIADFIKGQKNLPKTV